MSGAVFNSVQIITVYRSPVGNFGLFLENMELLLEKLTLRKGIIITGDFNVHFHAETREARLLCQLFLSFGLFKSNHYNTRGNACLDNIFTNLNSEFFTINIVDPSLSDHLALSFVYNRDERALPVANSSIVMRPITQQAVPP